MSRIRYPTFVAAGPDRASAFVFSHPGLHVSAASAVQTLDLVPDAIRDELVWLQGHGVASPPNAEPIEIWEVERIDLGSDVARGRWVGAFRYERRPTTEADVDLVLSRTALVRRDLEALLDTAADEVRAGCDALLASAADGVWNLMTRLGSRLEGELPPEPRERWRAAGRAAEERLRNLLPGDRERHAVFDGEEWTTRKVLRGLAIGERGLYREVAGVLSRAAPLSFGGDAASALRRRDTNNG